MQAIILPGLDGTSGLRQAFEAKLDAPGKCIAYPADQKLSYQALAHFVDSQLPVDEDYVLIAESFSGPVAVRIAAKAPKRLKGIVFVASFVKKPLPVPEQANALLDQISLHSDLLLRLGRPITFGKWGSSKLDTELSRAIRTVPEDNLRFRLSQVLGVDYAQKFESLKLPMMYLRPKQDRIIWNAVCKEMADLNNRLSIQEVDGPHFILHAQPEVAAEQVFDFIQNLKSK